MNKSIISSDYCSNDYQSDNESTQDSTHNDDNFNTINNIFTNYIYKDIKNNIETYVIPLQYVKHFKLWTLNRGLDKNHWKYIFKYQKKYYDNNNKFNFTSILTIAHYKNKLLIIDGQHRIKAITELCNTYNILDNIDVGYIRTDIIKTNNYNTLVNKFKEINFCRPIDTTYDEVTKIDMIEEFLKSYFKIEKKISYKNKNGEIKERILNSYIIKDNKKIPYLSRKDTMDKFKKSQILLSLPDKILFNLIKEINNEYSNSEIINKLSENQMNIMYMHNCFLSINDNWINELENKVNDNIDKYIL